VNKSAKAQGLNIQLIGDYTATAADGKGEILTIVILSETHICHSSESWNLRPSVKEWIPNRVWNDKSRQIEILHPAPLRSE